MSIWRLYVLRGSLSENLRPEVAVMWLDLSFTISLTFLQSYPCIEPNNICLIKKKCLLEKHLV